VELGIGTLVCGGTSRLMHGLATAYGIQVIPLVAGDLREVIWARLSGNLVPVAFPMPACSGRGPHPRREMGSINKEEYKMNGK
jgi:hypothetical protein